MPRCSSSAAAGWRGATPSVSRSARRLDGDHQFRPSRRPRCGGRARGVVRGARPNPRPSPAVFRQARLSHALRGAGEFWLNRPVLDLEKGYVVTPMALGLRLTTGAEFARLDDPPSSAHLERLEPFAREMFSLGPRKEAKPWLGRRPCLPDMRPVVGPFPGKPGLWLDFAHHHLGLTLGPISGRLLAEIMGGEPTVVDPAPFRAERFG